MIPPQAEASLALEKNTEIRKQKTMVTTAKAMRNTHTTSGSL